MSTSFVQLLFNVENTSCEYTVYVYMLYVYDMFDYFPFYEGNLI